jgi:putative membrane protein
MRYLYVALVVLVTAAVLLFKIQNLDTIILVYVLGMVSGGALLNVLRLWFQGATRKAG